MQRIKLTGFERDFLRRVTRAIFANPFSDERVRADLELVDVPSSTAYEDRTREIQHKIADEIDNLKKEGKKDVRKFLGEDRILVENVLLFNIYNRYYRSFDDLILRQIESDSPCKAAFAGEALDMIVGCGFSAAEASHYFSIFFQMRRAFHFIDRSIIGRSPGMKQLRLDLWNNVFTHDIGLYARRLWNRMEDYSTLLLGETGTGKGISASAIGRSGYIPFDKTRGCFAESFTRAFVSLNLSQFPEQLIESELFGHKKGAFTGAIADHEGIFSRCSPHGAIFLDEIGDVSVPLQIKLLQVLQERSFSPVGSHEKKRFSGRVVAATNRSLDHLRSENVFRDDFYYRLCSDVITVPPLRQRISEDPEELEDLINHTLTRIVGESSPPLAEKVSATIHEQLPPDYPWPGNVRELEQCIRSVLLKQRYSAERAVTAVNDLEEYIALGVGEGSMTAQGLLSCYCKLLYDRHGTYEAVSRITQLDRRTVKRYIAMQHS